MDKCREPRIKAIYFEVGDEPEEVLYDKVKERMNLKYYSDSEMEKLRIEARKKLQWDETI